LLLAHYLRIIWSFVLCRSKVRHCSQGRKNSNLKTEEQRSDINTGSPKKEVQHIFTPFRLFYYDSERTILFPSTSDLSNWLFFIQFSPCWCIPFKVNKPL
jgi:hypothetical protein